VKKHSVGEAFEKAEGGGRRKAREGGAVAAVAEEGGKGESGA